MGGSNLEIDSKHQSPFRKTLTQQRTINGISKCFSDTINGPLLKVALRGKNEIF
jgi:hypothetical protein